MKNLKFSFLGALMAMTIVAIIVDFCYAAPPGVSYEPGSSIDQVSFIPGVIASYDDFYAIRAESPTLPVIKAIGLSSYIHYSEIFSYQKKG